jgi:hypothetical protein
LFKKLGLGGEPHPQGKITPWRGRDTNPVVNSEIGCNKSFKMPILGELL